MRTMFGFSFSIFIPCLGSLMFLFLRHLIFDKANNGHENCATHAAAGDIAQDGRQIQRAATTRYISRYALEDRSSQAATDNSGDGISQGSQTIFFHGCPRHVAPDCTADYFNNEADDVHTFGFSLCLTVLRLNGPRRDPVEKAYRAVRG